MNIIVCIKQVPNTTQVRIDPVTNTLIRDGVPSIFNTFDRYALEQGLLLADAFGGTVTAVCMGPPQAKSILEEALAMGAGRAYLVSDRAFGGSDTLATSYILAAAIKKIGDFDLILCGKQAIDGDTGQVGPELAEHLELAQATYVGSIEKDGERLLAMRELSGSREVLEVSCPAIMTVTKNGHEPRFETIRGRLAANRTEIPVLTAADLDVDPERLGLKGSPTRVKRSFVPERHADCVRIEGGSAREMASSLLRSLAAAQVL